VKGLYNSFDYRFVKSTSRRKNASESAWKR